MQIADKTTTVISTRPRTGFIQVFPQSLKIMSLRDTKTCIIHLSGTKVAVPTSTKEEFLMLPVFGKSMAKKMFICEKGAENIVISIFLGTREKEEY